MRYKDIVGKISKLSTNLINLIAAGEVVERPASVLKELLENSIDAGSTNIVIDLVDYGIDSIKISDNGEGIEVEDLPLVFEQHATSKIRTENDLEAILSLGFRGEAVASISSVADEVEITTKSANHSGQKAIFSKQNLEIEEYSKPEIGTTIDVKNIFKNVPARRKFLKSPNTELRHIIDTFIQTAIPYTEIYFELNHNGKNLYKLTKTNDLTNRIFEIYGKQTARNLIYGSVDLGDIKIWGYVGNSTLGKKSNKNQAIFINNRFVKSGLINSAVKNGYTGHIHRDLNPTYFIFIELDPKEADINVHPRKLEVKFTDEQKIFGAISRFTDKTLESDSKSKFQESSSNSGRIEEGLNTRRVENRPLNQPLPSKSTSRFTKREEFKPRQQKISEAMSFTKSLFEPANNNFVAEDRHEYVAEQTNWKPIQIFNTYITFEKEGKIIFIDQHAAAEKIAFEKLIENFGSVQTKPLLIPEIIDLEDENEKNTLLEQKEELEKMGFIVGDFGDKSIQIVEVPEISNISDFQNIMDDFAKNEIELGIKVSNEYLTKHSLTKDIYLKVATIACHGSIRAGQKLENAEMIRIINDVNKIKGSLNCPHGRPILWELSKSQLEKNFNRDI